MTARRNISEIDVQIMWNRLLSVVEEQARALVRTAFSTSAREAGDISAGVFDLEGRMLAQAVTGTPGHVNSMARSVIHFIREFPVETMKPGDAYVTNDPWSVRLAASDSGVRFEHHALKRLTEIRKRDVHVLAREAIAEVTV